jgi:peptide/nickel transport system substrate-binding protein
MTEFEYKLAMATQAVGRRKASRREFMQLAMAAGFSASAAGTMFTTAARAAPQKGGHFKTGLGHGATTDSFDPATWAHGMNFTWGKGVMGAQLCRVDANANVIPHLAESFEPSDGAKKWVFTLRKGVTFHNGKSLTSDDVVATINYHTGADSKSPAKALLAAMTSCKADGPDKVVFELSAGNADFPALMTAYQLPIYPAVDGKMVWDKGIGAGPYILESFEPGVKLVAKRNPNYFGETWFDSIEQLSILDTAARTNAYLSGEVHFIDKADLKTIDLLKAAPDTEIYNVPGYEHYTAPMFTDTAPFDKVEVRQALKWAINRQELVDKVLFGYGKAGNDIPLNSKMKFAIDPQPGYSYDPDKAKSLLKKAGMDGLKVDLSASDAAFGGAVDAGQLMVEQAKVAGIDINLIREPNDGYWDNVWLKKAWCMCFWGGRPTVDMFLTISLAAEAAWNDTHWKNPRFNELLVAARSETDDKKRAEMYSEAQMLIHDDGGQTVLMFANYVGAYNNKLAHGDLNSDLEQDGGYIYDKWWFNA